MSRAGQAIKRLAEKKAHQAQPVFHGEIVRVGPPMKVELFFRDRLLEEDDDFDLSHAMRLHRHEHGIHVGDTVLMMHEGGSWSLFDIHTDDLEPTLEKAKTVKAINAKIEKVWTGPDRAASTDPDGGVWMNDWYGRGLRIVKQGTLRTLNLIASKDSAITSSEEVLQLPAEFAARADGDNYFGTQPFWTNATGDPVLLAPSVSADAKLMVDRITGGDSDYATGGSFFLTSGTWMV